jgi:hypothetical protein
MGISISSPQALQCVWAGYQVMSVNRCVLFVQKKKAYTTEAPFCFAPHSYAFKVYVRGTGI